MFSRNLVKRPQIRSSAPVAPAVTIEPLEDRRLLSASDFGFGFGFGRGHSLNTIQFSQAPAAVQTGLTNLASTDHLTAPTATQTVFLRNANGLETYSIDIAGTGTQSVLTVKADGTPVTAPTNGTITFGDLSGTGTSANAAAAKEITAIASALSLTAPASTTSIRVSTSASTGISTYTVRLSPASITTGTTTTTPRHFRSVSIQVDSNGNPVGNQSIPFSAIPTAIQTALNNNRPSGATALDTTSTQRVRVRTLNGVTTYSLTFTGTGTQTTVTVNAGGVLTSLPSSSTTTYSALQTSTPKAATELQTLATAAGGGTIDAGATVQVYNEGNGTTIYSVSASVSQTTDSGISYTRNVTVSSDQDGNPTTLPQNAGGGRGGFGFGGFSFGGFRFGGFRFGGFRF